MPGETLAEAERDNHMTAFSAQDDENSADLGGEAARYQVCLVSMPMGIIHAPSPGMGIVHSSIEREGFSVRSFHLTLDFVSWIGLPDYLKLMRRGNFLFEWLFLDRRAGSEINGKDDEFREILRRSSGLGREDFDLLWRCALQVRDRISPFVQISASKIMAGEPRIVGCSSTFQQVNSSLAMLREIKRLNPSVVTIMGGANCEEPMGSAIHRNFAFVDYIVVGEADMVAGALARRILCSPEGRQPDMRDDGVMGPGDRAAGNRGKGRVMSLRSSAENIKKSPFPCYKDYFADLEESEFGNLVIPSLPVELARGCWWAAKEPCTFCGLNVNPVKYRTRPVDAVMADLLEKIIKFSVTNITFVDNVVNPATVEKVASGLEPLGGDVSVFMEIRADMPKPALQKLVKAGRFCFNPGIESFSDELLTLMNKGVDGVTNVAFLKWCRQLGVRTGYNLLYGFPGESPKWYEAMADLIDSITHLSPASTGQVQFERYSRYFKEPGTYGLQLIPSPEYRLIYDVPECDISHMAYHFVAVDPPFDTRGSGHGRFMEAIAEWNRAWGCGEPPLLEVREFDGRFHRIADTRRKAVSEEHIVSCLEYDMLEYLDTPRTVEELEVDFGLSVSDVKSCLEKMVDKKLVIYLSDKYLSLVFTLPPEKFQSKPGSGYGAFLPDLFVTRPEDHPFGIPDV